MSQPSKRMLGLVAELVRELGGDAPAVLKHLRNRSHANGLLTVSRLCRAYLRFADEYYGHTDGEAARESERIENGLRPLRRLFGRTHVQDFGPLRLKRVREEMISMGWCRRGVNQQIGRIKRMLKWATENEMIPADVYHAVSPVAGLRAGRSKARESLPVKPAPQSLIDGVVAIVSSPIRAMIELQLLTGMRPGEVVIMRTRDIDMSDETWIYRPWRHKTAVYGHDRTVHLGPQAQEILKPFLRPASPDAFLFSPADADRERREKLRAQCKTPMSCGNSAGTNRKRRPLKKPGQRYVAHTYARAIKYACQTAFPVPSGTSGEDAKSWKRAHHWHPHQLRHNAATRFRKQFGLDVAQVLLGHQTLTVTQIYADKNHDLAQKVVKEVG